VARHGWSRLRRLTRRPWGSVVPGCRPTVAGFLQEQADPNDHRISGGQRLRSCRTFLARYLPKHIPGEPTIIVQNMPSAASIAAANFLYAQAPRDGTVFGSFSRNMPSQALMGQANVEADPRRFNWLGATSLPARVCVRWVTAPIRTPAD